MLSVVFTPWRPTIRDDPHSTMPGHDFVTHIRNAKRGDTRKQRKKESLATPNILCPKNARSMGPRVLSTLFIFVWFRKNFLWRTITHCTNSCEHSFWYSRKCPFSRLSHDKYCPQTVQVLCTSRFVCRQIFFWDFLSTRRAIFLECLRHRQTGGLHQRGWWWWWWLLLLLSKVV